MKDNDLLTFGLIALLGIGVLIATNMLKFRPPPPNPNPRHDLSRDGYVDLTDDF